MNDYLTLFNKSIEQKQYLKSIDSKTYKYAEIIKPQTFNELMDLFSLKYRTTTEIDFYLKNRNEQYRSLRYPPLEHILKSSNGLILYREQITNIFLHIADLMEFELDFLHNAQGKRHKEDCKKAFELIVNASKESDSFIKCCLNFGIDFMPTIEYLWNITLENNAKSCRTSFALYQATKVIQEIRHLNTK